MKQHDSDYIIDRSLNDLAWCAFVIQNDYLQISNSISCGALQEKTKNKKENRRFSKTITTNLIQRNKNQVECMLIQMVSSLITECMSENTARPALRQFSEYFAQPDYDSYKIDEAVDGNSLMFTLMYVAQKNNWK